MGMVCGRRALMRLCPPSALVARVINKEVLGEYTRFDIQVTNVYKRSRAVRVRRGGDQLWVRNQDLVCKCPKIKMGK